MMKSKIVIEEKLKKYAQFKTEEDIANFDNLVSEISKLKDSNYIPLLINVLDDETEFPEVMYTIVHALEHYSKDVHAKSIVENTPYLLKHAPGWLLSLVYPILNTPSSLRAFKENIHLIPKKDMIKLLDLVAQESENHRDICKELKKELN